jgi:hypothetical protein
MHFIASQKRIVRFGILKICSGSTNVGNGAWNEAKKSPAVSAGDF